MNWQELEKEFEAIRYQLRDSLYGNTIETMDPRRGAEIVRVIDLAVTRTAMVVFGFFEEEMCSMKRLNPASSIPNIDGYKILAKIRNSDGSYGWRIVQVKRGEDGLHRLDGVDLDRVIGWYEVEQ